MGSAAHNRATAKYDAEHVIRVAVKLNKKTDADILRVLEKEENKSGYIKAAIRAAMEKTNKPYS